MPAGPPRARGAYDNPGTFMQAYAESRSNAIQALLEIDIVALAVSKLVLPWEGPIGNLLPQLTAIVGEQQAKSKAWPKTARGLSSALRRLVPFLHEHRIAIEPPLKNDKTRKWTIRAVDPQPPQQPEQPPRDNPPEINGFGGSGGLGGHFPNNGDGYGDEDAESGQTLFVGKQQPEQPEPPEDCISTQECNGLAAGRSAACAAANGPNSPRSARVWVREIVPVPLGPPGDDLRDFK